jgi:hypothetical protein
MLNIGRQARGGCETGVDAMNAVTGALLIGSVPLADAETVFRSVAPELGPHLARIPDGETGNRGRWIWWQREMLLHHPAMEPDTDTPPFEVRQWDGALLRTTDWLRFRSGVDPATVTLDTGYAAAARESYAIFRRLRDAGEIPAGTRFQVCLPTPMASGHMYVSPASLAAYLPTYERALLAALHDIVDAIPHRDLSLPTETALYLGLIRHADVESDHTRIAAAHKVLPQFGVATECGWGRTDQARVPGLLAAHRSAIEGVTD